MEIESCKTVRLFGKEINVRLNIDGTCTPITDIPDLEDGSPIGKNIPNLDLNLEEESTSERENKISIDESENEDNNEEEEEEVPEPLAEEDMLTDVGSDCSGLSDLSGISDLEEDLEAMEEVDDDKPTDRKGGKQKKLDTVSPGAGRARGKRAGQKHTESKRRLAGSMGHSIAEAAQGKKAGTVEFTKENPAKKSNMWRKKLEKRRKIKHQT